MARAPAVDLVVGPQSYHGLASLVAEAATSGRGVVATDFPAEDKFAQLPPRSRQASQPSAFITVQEGCGSSSAPSASCPIRGAPSIRARHARSSPRPSGSPQGAREITLLGQNVNAYRGRGPDERAWSLARLLRRLADCHVFFARLRYTTSHPLDMDDELIALFAEEPKLMPYLHLPFQSGSDRILKAMNRKHVPIADYEAVIGKVRTARPDIAVSTDIIVGFPGGNRPRFGNHGTRRPSAFCPGLHVQISRGRARPRQVSRARSPRR